MVIETLITALEEFGFPVFLQGSLSPAAQYPEHFFTFWNNDSYDLNHFDNQRAGIAWDFDVNAYSSDPTKVMSMTEEAINALRSVGFVISGAGYAVASDEPTHTGRGFNAIYIERLEVTTHV